MRLMFFKGQFLLVWMCLLGFSVAEAQSAASSGGEASATILARARKVMLVGRADGSVLHYRAVSASEQNYQSDRTYPPFFSSMDIEEGWFDPQSGIERIGTLTTFPGYTAPQPRVVVTNGKGAFSFAEGHWSAMPPSFLQSRNLDPWAVVADWIAAENVRYAGTEMYRDYSRDVLVRKGTSGELRLFVDPKTGFPVKLDLEEKHYLWGQRHIEYLYTNWTLVGNVMVAGSSFRLADGKTEISRTTGEVKIQASSSAPEMSKPDVAPQPEDALPRFLQPIDPTVTPVGSNTYLLSNPGYTELVSRVGDEVFLFDATQGEDRARKDSAAIDKLFPGHKTITVIVTDLAWPHVAGVRYWVAEGATIISHPAAREFLQSVVDRKWTLSPDPLEVRRGTAKLKFVEMDSRLSLAGGSISLHPIDGIGSEVAIIAYLSNDHLLWASDFIQSVDGPSSYATEVWQAVHRDGLHPERTVAEHLPLTPWSKIEALQTLDNASGDSNSK